MKIKIDENLPTLLEWPQGHDIDTVIQEGLAGKNDETVFECARIERRLFITQDLDFSDIRKYLPGTHFGLVLIRLADPSRETLGACLTEILESTELESWAGCFVVVSETKIRVRRP